MLGVMADFMRQFVWATVPRYSVKHYSGCFHDSDLNEINI